MKKYILTGLVVTSLLVTMVFNVFAAKLQL